MAQAETGSIWKINRIMSENSGSDLYNTSAGHWLLWKDQHRNNNWHSDTVIWYAIVTYYYLQLDDGCFLLFCLVAERGKIATGIPLQEGARGQTTHDWREKTEAEKFSWW